VICASIWRVQLVVVGIGSPVNGVFTLTLTIIIFGWLVLCGGAPGEQQAQTN
jgi:hypothetical protein